MSTTPVDIESVKSLCRNNLWFLSTEMLGYRDWDIVHNDIETFVNRRAKRKLLLVPRGHLKSSIVTKAYSIQRILRNPNIRILIANQVWDRSRDMLFEIKEFLSTKSELPKLFGKFDSGRWRDEEIVIGQRTKALSAPTIATTGVEAEMTSAHFDLILLDDLQGLNNCQTKEQRDKVKRFYRSLTALLDPPDPLTGEGGEMIVIGTRWHHDDLYSEIMSNESDYYDVMVRKVIEDNKVIFPKKFNMRFDSVTKSWTPAEDTCFDYINFLRDSLGPDFNSQYMNDPVDAENQLIKREYFKYYKGKPEKLYVAVTMDPALSYSQRSDFTAIMACGMDDKRNIYVLDYVRGHWGSPHDIINQVIATCDRWKPHALGIEENVFQKSLSYFIAEMTQKKKSVPPITPLKAPVTKSKELRLKALEPYYRNGMVFHHESMKGKDLENELLNLTSDGYKGKNDDLFDALAWQLDLLMTGSHENVERIPVGSWAWEEIEARKMNMPYKKFFES